MPGKKRKSVPNKRVPAKLQTRLRSAAQFVVESGFEVEYDNLVADILDEEYGDNEAQEQLEEQAERVFAEALKEQIRKHRETTDSKDFKALDRAFEELKTKGIGAWHNISDCSDGAWETVTMAEADGCEEKKRDKFFKGVVFYLSTDLEPTVLEKKPLVLQYSEGIGKNNEWEVEPSASKRIANTIMQTLRKHGLDPKKAPNELEIEVPMNWARRVCPELLEEIE